MVFYDLIRNLYLMKSLMYCVEMAAIKNVDRKTIPTDIISILWGMKFRRKYRPIRTVASAPIHEGMISKTHLPASPLKSLLWVTGIQIIT